MLAELLGNGMDTVLWNCIEAREPRTGVFNLLRSLSKDEDNGNDNDNARKQ